MTSRRPMIRTYSGNGRTSSFSEDEGNSSNGRSESRNTYLSNVRPENSYSRYSHYRPSRSTLCSVMAQLTEDIQPSFERTLKSKAVSENCNVKFICVVSGFPAPELKWYKDDMEMDRYCGLPKYEIHRNGKTHTLHIYNCTLDDAAIYQVSASNSKGIVSCSGVLEVGDMNEYKIHQRFFSKLKQKAENKKKTETEAQGNKKEDKENTQEKMQISPERPPRKRHIAPPVAVKEAAAVEQQGAVAGINGVNTEVRGAGNEPSKGNEPVKDEALSEKALATKKLKISNGVDAGVNSSNLSKSQELRNGGENCYDGGISLTQFLAETLQSQTSEEKQSSEEGDRTTETDLTARNASKGEDKRKEDMRKDREEEEKRQQEECERQKRRDEELATEKAKEREKQIAASQMEQHAKHGSETKLHSKAHKDHEHHNIQASLSSMLHSVKDFLFGKSKKDSPDHVTNKDREVSHSSASQAEMPPSFQLQEESQQVCQPVTGDAAPVEIDKGVLEAQDVSLGLQGSRHKDSVPRADQPPANKLKLEMMEGSMGQSVNMGNDAAEAMEISVVPESCSPGEDMPLTGQVLTEAEAASLIKALDRKEISSQFNNKAASDDSGDTYVRSQNQKSSEDKSSPIPTPTSVEDSWTLPQRVAPVLESNNKVRLPSDVRQIRGSAVDETLSGPKPGASSEGEKAEVKTFDAPQLDINGHEIIKLAFFVEERIESSEFETPNQVHLPTGTASVEKENVKEEAKRSQTIEEMNAGSPMAAAMSRLQKKDVSKNEERTISGVEKRLEGRGVDSVLSPISDLRRNEQRSKLAGVFAEETEVNSGKKQERQEAELVEGDGCTSVDDKDQRSSKVRTGWPSEGTPKDQKPAAVTGQKPVTVTGQKPVPVIDQKPVPVIGQKPVPVTGQKPVTVTGQKPVPVIDHKTVTVTDQKPVPVIGQKPVPVIDHKTVTVTDQKPVPVIDQKPVPVIGQKPVPVTGQKPVTVTGQKPVPVIDHKTVTVTDQKPVPVIGQKPVPVIDHKTVTVTDQKPVPVIGHKPVPVIDHKTVTVTDQKPVPVIGQKPVPVIDHKPVTVTDQKPVPVTDQKPVPVIDHKPVTVIGQKPVTVIDHKPVPVTDQKPVPVTDQKPVPVIDQKPVPVIGQKPVPVIDHKPVTVTDQKPVPVIDQKPVPVIGQKPVPVIDQKPATVTGQKPVTVIDHKPVTVIGQKPATVIGQKPVTVTGQKPVTAIDQKPVPVIGQKPVTVIGQKPVTVIDQKPVTVIDQKPVTVTDQKPVPVIDQKPVTVTGQKPVPVTDQKPVTVIGQKPVTVIGQKPVPVIDQKPVTVTDQKPVPVIDQKPVPVTDQKPVPVTGQKPVSVTGQKPVPVTDQKPVPVTGQKPVTVIGQKPVPVTDHKPVPVTDQKPVPVIDQKPSKVIDQKPVTVTGQKPVPVTGQKPAAVTNRNLNEGFIIPKIEVIEPEVKESTSLALNKQESESAGVQKHDATQVQAAMTQRGGMTDSLRQRFLQDDKQPTPGENVEAVEQPAAERTGSLEGELHVRTSERPPQMASVPVINVSCVDHKENEAYALDTHPSDRPQVIETLTLPAFVVPPISVTSHESERTLRLTAESDSLESDAVVTTPRVTKQKADTSTVTPDTTQIRQENLEETTEKTLKDSTLSPVGDGSAPNAGNNDSSVSKTVEHPVFPENTWKKTHKEAKIENFVSVQDLQRSHPPVDRLASKPPTHPSLSPSSLRKFMSRAALESDNEVSGGQQNDKSEDDLSGGSTPTLPLSCESSPRMKRRNSLTLIRSATPEELASGARRKIFMPRPKEEGEGTQDKKDSPYMSPSQARRAALLQCPTGQSTPPMERRSPLVSRRKATLEVPKFMDEPSPEEPDSTKKEEKPTEKKPDPLKAPQVIRKIRAEPFPDASGHLKLWCQFFNVLIDSTIKWFRDEEEILQVKRSGGDESQVALAIVLATSQDCGVYGCSISNEYGADTTDFLLSVDVLSQILLKDDLEVGEEIEMTPLLFTKGLADPGSWGEKYFGRIMTETVHVGSGCAHKASRVRAIYGLEPIFESGSTCIVKARNPIAYGSKQESNLAERNGAISKQECKVQNMIREYCKIFTAEARVSENFGFSLEVIPQYLVYRPANSVPYATVEADLNGPCLKYCTMDPKGKLMTQTVSEVEQKCSTFQHWIHQWTHGNLLVTQMEGVECKLTNIRVVTKSKGYQGLTEGGSPEVFEQFLTHHQCNYYCGLLGLVPLKTLESLQQPKTKGSRSPLLTRKGSSSPQMQRKGHSPQMSRKANSSPKVARKAPESEDDKSGAKTRPTESVVEMR